MEVTADGRIEDPRPKIVMADFYCNGKPFGIPCGATWKSQHYRECPKCNKRTWVKKGAKPEQNEAA